MIMKKIFLLTLAFELRTKIFFYPSLITINHRWNMEMKQIDLEDTSKKVEDEEEVIDYLGLKQYDTEYDYDLPADCPDSHKGYGSGVSLIIQTIIIILLNELFTHNSIFFYIFSIYFISKFPSFAVHIIILLSLLVQ